MHPRGPNLDKEPVCYLFDPPFSPTARPATVVGILVIP